MSQDEYRQVLNKHRGLSNIIEGDDITVGMTNVISRIKDILKDHCGPYGKFATRCDVNPAIKPTFTKDGINIVEGIELISPLERYMKEQIQYIGKKVERAAGDGTTSSMIIASKLMELFLDFDLNGVAYNDFYEDYNKFVRNLGKILNELAIITDPEDKEMVRQVAYTQAMTSSHGNKDLSEKIAEIFATSPRKSWDNLRYKRNPYEGSQQFEIEVNDSDYHCRAYPHNNKMMNNERGDERNHETCDIIFSTTGLVDMSIDYDYIKGQIEQRLEEDNPEPLIIIIPHHADATTRGEIDTILHKRDPKKVIGIFSVRTTDNVRINDMVAMSAVFGSYYYELTDNPLVLKGAKFDYRHGEIYISNVVERTEENIHPDVDDDESPVASFLAILDQAIEDVNNGIASTDFASKLDNYDRIYNAVMLQRVQELKIGGVTYDNAAMLPVVDDSIKAAREALREGIVLGSFETLREALTSYWVEKDYELESHEHGNRFIEALTKAIDEVHEGLYRFSGKEVEHTSPGTGIDVKSGQTYTLDDIGKDKLMITQPLSVDLTLLKRFGEVGLKFIFTNRTIVPNGVCMDEKTSDD